MIATDPVYLTEPMINTEEFVVMDRGNTNWLYNCETAEEVPRLEARRAALSARHQPEPRRILPTRSGLPLEAVRGGAETMYPEYRAKLRAR